MPGIRFGPSVWRHPPDLYAHLESPYFDVGRDPDTPNYFIVEPDGVPCHREPALEEATRLARQYTRELWER